MRVTKNSVFLMVPRKNLYRGLLKKAIFVTLITAGMNRQLKQQVSRKQVSNY